jgi:hypothetical protein
VSDAFDPKAPSIRVRGVLVGPQRAVDVLFRLDTGASRTSVRSHILRLAGYDPSAGQPLRFRSATGIGTGLAVPVRHLVALDQTRDSFLVIAHDPPPAVITDGLLGLDFFRGLVLTLDFARGRIDLGPSRPWWRPWR